MPIFGPPTVTESIETRHTVIRDNRLTGVRIFHVANVENPSLALGAAGIPQYGEAFPDDPSLIAMDFDAGLVEGHSTLVRIEVEYRESEFIPPEENDDDLGSTTFQVKAQGQFVEAWRLGPGLVLPMNGNADNSAFDDIQGVRSDVSGEPVSFLKRTVSFVISETIQQKAIDVPLYYSFTGSRNSAAFFGFVPGSLLYLGADVTGTFGSGKVRLSHEFLADEWYHMRQAPVRDQNGTVSLFKLPSQGGGPGVHVAETVYWRQPFTVLKPFHGISENF